MASTTVYASEMFLVTAEGGYLSLFLRTGLHWELLRVMSDLPVLRDELAGELRGLAGWLAPEVDLSCTAEDAEVEPAGETPVIVI
jgi:hypothetical protein